jgi:hypothetical protein
VSPKGVRWSERGGSEVAPQRNAGLAASVHRGNLCGTRQTSRRGFVGAPKPRASSEGRAPRARDSSRVRGVSKEVEEGS